MNQRITIRLDENLSAIIKHLQQRGIFNLSALIREVLRDGLGKVLGIDNSGMQEELKKGNDI